MRMTPLIFCQGLVHWLRTFRFQNSKNLLEASAGDEPVNSFIFKLFFHEYNIMFSSTSHNFYCRFKYLCYFSAKTQQKLFIFYFVYSFVIFYEWFFQINFLFKVKLNKHFRVFMKFVCTLQVFMKIPIYLLFSTPVQLISQVLGNWQNVL